VAVDFLIESESDPFSYGERVKYRISPKEITALCPSRYGSNENGAFYELSSEEYNSNLKDLIHAIESNPKNSIPIIKNPLDNAPSSEYISVVDKEILYPESNK